jgi:SAM-dependent methyltransferase
MKKINVISDNLRDQTIADFGHQWTTYTTNDGFYGSLELLEDILNPFIQLPEISKTSVAEIGSGSGRIVNMLSEAGASKITAIEPSGAINILRENVIGLSAEVVCVHSTGEVIGDLGPFDLVVSIGVLHHIPDPTPVVRAAFNSLAPKGKLLVWLYGAEGNELYLLVLSPLRWLARLLPRFALPVLTWMLYPPLWVYINICRVIPLPLADYMTNVIGKMSPDKQRLVIYDQLNPAYAKYYTRTEAEQLLQQAGFEEVMSHHRRGYSWTVIGSKPDI